MGMSTIRERRPRVVVVELVLLGFLALTAIGGGLEMLLFPQGNPFVKTEWLESIPFDDWVIPGLILGFGFGFGSVLVLWGILRRPSIGWLDRIASPTRHHWSWLGSMILGAGLVLWILVEIVFIPERSAVEAAYLGIGLALAVLPWAPSLSAHLRSSRLEAEGSS
jgi:hypothetical protein